MAVLNGYPYYSGWLLDICSSRSEETIHIRHGDSKTGCFWNSSEGIIDHPCAGERAGVTGPRAKSLGTAESKLGWFINRRTAGSGQAAICQMLIEQSPGGVSATLGGKRLLNTQLIGTEKPTKRRVEHKMASHALPHFVVAQQGFAIASENQLG